MFTSFFFWYKENVLCGLELLVVDLILSDWHARIIETLDIVFLSKLLEAN